jgi:hypothetical protein
MGWYANQKARHEAAKETDRSLSAFMDAKRADPDSALARAEAKTAANKAAKVERKAERAARKEAKRSGA